MERKSFSPSNLLCPLPLKKWHPLQEFELNNGPSPVSFLPCSFVQVALKVWLPLLNLRILLWFFKLDAGLLKALRVLSNVVVSPPESSSFWDWYLSHREHWVNRYKNVMQTIILFKIKIIFNK